MLISNLSPLCLLKVLCAPSWSTRAAVTKFPSWMIVDEIPFLSHSSGGPTWQKWPSSAESLFPKGLHPSLVQVSSGLVVPQALPLHAILCHYLTFGGDTFKSQCVAGLSCRPLALMGQETPVLESAPSTGPCKDLPCHGRTSARSDP